MAVRDGQHPSARLLGFRGTSTSEQTSASVVLYMIYQGMDIENAYLCWVDWQLGKPLALPWNPPEIDQ